MTPRFRLAIRNLTYINSRTVRGKAFEWRGARRDCVTGAAPCSGHIKKSCTGG